MERLNLIELRNKRRFRDKLQMFYTAKENNYHKRIIVRNSLIAVGVLVFLFWTLVFIITL